MVPDNPADAPGQLDEHEHSLVRRDNELDRRDRTADERDRVADERDRDRQRRGAATIASCVQMNARMQPNSASAIDSIALPKVRNVN